ncbi:hypothetical protein I317_05717 [Kwoniella heveanensis CBS 569]|nr:hypothetical protein I317_05717 [Kwoniella heveanensis CBS 569]
MATDQPDLPSTTPLDLLINAIAGSSRYAFPSHTSEGDVNVDDTHPRDGADAAASSVGSSAFVDADSHLRLGNKRPRQERSPSPRQKKLTKTLASYIAATSSSSSHSGSKPSKATSTLGLHGAVDILTTGGGAGDTESRVEVWHPTTGQKSYGKERRILAPPPILRVSGAILSSISSVTLSTCTNTSIPTPISGSETHRILDTPDQMPLPEAESTAEAETTKSGGRKKKKSDKKDAKRNLRQAARNAGFGATLAKSRGLLDGRDRSCLIDGLGFPGLWVGEEVGKMKEFLLDLKVDLDGKVVGPTESVSALQEPATDVTEGKGETKVPEDVIGIGMTPNAEPQSDPYAQVAPTDGLEVDLDPSSMEVLQPLAEAVRQANQVTNHVLADHLQIPASFEAAPESTEAGMDPTLTGIDVDGSGNPATPRAELSSCPVQVTPSRPWATFTSSPLRIVSKPSQKTAKARSMASCFSTSASFALWTRIHGQTVRTKYMKLETGNDDDDDDGDDTPQDVQFKQSKLVSKTGKWTPFRFEIVQRAAPPKVDRSKNRYHHPSNYSEGENEDKLTYGSIVILVDLQSGIRSDPVKIVKVESGEVRVGEDVGQPISELQRIGLVRLVNGAEDTTGGDGGRWYLSAPGARLGGGELSDGNAAQGRRRTGKKASVVPTSSTMAGEIPGAGASMPPHTLNSIEQSVMGIDTPLGSDIAIPSEPMASGQCDNTTNQHEDQYQDLADGRPKKKVKTKRNALAAAVLAEDEDGGAQNILTWTQSTRRIDEQEQGLKPQSGGETGAIVEKVEDWMSWIIGGVSCFTYSFFSTSDSLAVQAKTIDPVPRILVPPVFHPTANTLDLHLSEFFFCPAPTLPPLSTDTPRAQAPHNEPLEVYLGPIGPLDVTTWRSTAPRNLPTPAIPYHDNDDANNASHDHSRGSVVRTRTGGSGGGLDGVMSSFPADLKHVIVVVHMPDAEEIISAMHSCAVQAHSQAEVTAEASTQNIGDNGGGRASVLRGSSTDVGDDADRVAQPDQGGSPLQLQHGLSGNMGPDQDVAGQVESTHPGPTPDDLSIAAALEMTPNLDAFGAFDPFNGEIHENGSHAILLAQEANASRSRGDQAVSIDPHVQSNDSNADEVIDPSLMDFRLQEATATAIANSESHTQLLPPINGDGKADKVGGPEGTNQEVYSSINTAAPTNHDTKHQKGNGTLQHATLLLHSPVESKTNAKQAEDRDPESVSQANVIAPLPLPLLLLRQSDGLVFRTGRSVVAERIGQNPNSVGQARLHGTLREAEAGTDMDKGMGISEEKGKGKGQSLDDTDIDRVAPLEYGGGVAGIQWGLRVVED